MMRTQYNLIFSFPIFPFYCGVCDGFEQSNLLLLYCVPCWMVSFFAILQMIFCSSRVSFYWLLRFCIHKTANKGAHRPIHVYTKGDVKAWFCLVCRRILKQNFHDNNNDKSSLQICGNTRRLIK